MVNKKTSKKIVRKTQNKSKKVSSNKKNNILFNSISKLGRKNIIIFTVLVFALIGTIVILKTRAAVSSSESELGFKSKEVTVVKDPSASGGEYALFANEYLNTVTPSTQRFPGDSNPLKTGKSYWGAAVGGNDDPYPRHEQSTGKSLSIRRTFFGWNNRTNSMISTAKNDLTSNRLPWVSLKTPTGSISDWSKLANGTYDAQIDEMLIALDNIGGKDKPVWLTIWHEPENDNGSATDWRNMQKRIRDRINALKNQGKPMDNIAFAPILMDWTFDPASGRNPNDWWVDGIWDFYGVDPYCYASCSSKGKFILDMTSWKNFVAFVENKKMPFAIGEWGDTNPDSVAAQNMKKWWNWGFANKKDIVGYSEFDSGLNPPPGTTVDTTLQPLSLEVFQDILKNDTRVQRVNELKSETNTTATNYGTITQKFNLAEGGSYKLWVRTSPNNGTNALGVQVDNGVVFSMGGPTTSSGWTWIDFKNGEVNNKTLMNLNPGEHTITLIGTNKGVKVDKLLLTNENCIPEGTGNCPVSNIPTNPTAPASKYTSIKINSPTSGQTVSGNTIVKVDPGSVSIAEVSFRVDDVWQFTDNQAPFEWAWDTTKFTNDNHTVVARVRINGDSGSVNSGDQIYVVSKVNNVMAPTTSPTPPADSENPSTPSSLRASLRFDWTRLSYVIDLNWQNSIDNDKVSQYIISRNGEQLGTSAAPYYTDNKSMTAGNSYTYSVVAKDPAGNTSKEGKLNISTSCALIFCSIQVL